MPQNVRPLETHDSQGWLVFPVDPHAGRIAHAERVLIGENVQAVGVFLVGNFDRNFSPDGMPEAVGAFCPQDVQAPFFQPHDNPCRSIGRGLHGRLADRHGSLDTACAGSTHRFQHEFLRGWFSGRIFCLHTDLEAFAGQIDLARCTEMDRKSLDGQDKVDARCQVPPWQHHLEGKHLRLGIILRVEAESHLALFIGDRRLDGFTRQPIADLFLTQRRAETERDANRSLNLFTPIVHLPWGVDGDLHRINLERGHLKITLKHMAFAIVGHHPILAERCSLGQEELVMQAAVGIERDMNRPQRTIGGVQDLKVELAPDGSNQTICCSLEAFALVLTSRAGGILGCFCLFHIGQPDNTSHINHLPGTVDRAIRVDQPAVR